MLGGIELGFHAVGLYLLFAPGLHASTWPFWKGLPRCKAVCPLALSFASHWNQNTGH
jgi:hypothetical protein